MLWRVRNSRGRPLNAPAAFIHPCQPIVAAQPPSGPGWAHELKHDGYRLQVHVRERHPIAINQFFLLPSHGRFPHHLY
jgi:ATP-dependent DNA ligase